MQIKLKKTQLIIFILIIASVITASIIYYGYAQESAICNLDSDCEIVQNSPYAKIFGFPLSTLGIISSILLLVIYLLVFNKKIPYKIFLAITYIGAAFAIYFIYIQLFILKAICSTCMAIDLIIILIALMATHEYSKSKNN
tara:strand:- start:853 stop:1275 length:423 start_codon:yes stop_codon:yes gene_type:complete